MVPMMSIALSSGIVVLRSQCSSSCTVTQMGLLAPEDIESEFERSDPERMLYASGRGIPACETEREGEPVAAAVGVVLPAEDDEEMDSLSWDWVSAADRAGVDIPRGGRCGDIALWLTRVADALE